ncbi:MAG: hypothetical protein ACR2H1_03470 [Limisphaerales bacterium]
MFKTTSAAYAVTSVQPGVTGNYRVIVFNQLNSVTSSVVVVSIDSAFKYFATNLVVIRVGDGTQIPTISGNSMFLDQFTQSGSYVNTFNIPEGGAFSLMAIGLNNVNGTTGNVSSSGLTSSANGQQLVIAGYNTNLNDTENISTVAATAVPRGGWRH